MFSKTNLTLYTQLAMIFCSKVLISSYLHFLTFLFIQEQEKKALFFQIFFSSRLIPLGGISAPNLIPCSAGVGQV